MIMRTRAAIALVLVFTLPACADGTRTPSITAPDARLSLDLSDGDGPAALTSAVGAQQTATGARASGHVETFSAFFGATYKYSFIVLATTPTPTEPQAAKGQVQATILRTVGSTTVTETIHAEIDCASFINIPIPIFGRMANVSGPIKKWTRDGQPVPFPPGEEVLFTVQDNGEGEDARPDRASAVVTTNGTQNCRILFIGMNNTDPGNIQVVFPGERGSGMP